MPAYLSPVGNEVQTDANGNPLVGGQIFTYQAGTTTPIATYTGSDAGTAQANPIVLNSAGLPDSPIWLPAGQAVKLVFKGADGVTLRTVDNITGINDPSTTNTVDQWVTFSGAPTYISATSFSLAGDQTNTFQVGRRVKSTNTGGTVYSTISASSYNAGTGLTTVTVTNDSGSLDSGMSIVSYGLLSATNPSAPVRNSQIRLNGSGGYGSTNTKVRRFANVQTQQGSDISFADSSTLGTSLMVNVAGCYSMTWFDNFTGGEVIGFTLDYSTGSTSVRSVPAANVLAAASVPNANLEGCVSVTIYLPAGSVVRPVTAFASAVGTGATPGLVMQRVA